MALAIVLVEGRFDARLAGTEIVQGRIEVVLVETGKPEHFGDGVIACPAHGGESGALMSDAGQDEKEGEFGHLALAQGSGNAEAVGDLFERVEQAEDGTTDRSEGSQVIEFAAEQAAQDVNPCGGPGGEVGEGAVLDLAIFAEALAKENRRRGIAIGYRGHVHANSI